MAHYYSLPLPRSSRTQVSVTHYLLSIPGLSPSLQPHVWFTDHFVSLPFHTWATWNPNEDHSVLAIVLSPTCGQDALGLSSKYTLGLVSDSFRYLLSSQHAWHMVGIMKCGTGVRDCWLTRGWRMWGRGSEWGRLGQSLLLSWVWLNHRDIWPESLEQAEGYPKSWWWWIT